MTFKLPDRQRLDWSKGDGLLPAIVQHWRDGRVLMLGYMSRESLDATLDSGKVTFFSRSKQRLWMKGERSGHVLTLKDLRVDCDGDTLLVLADPHGPTCHRGSESCFGNDAASELTFLDQLDALISKRDAERPDGSYTSDLLQAGIRHIAQKVGEEGVETALAAVAQTDEELLGEAADLIYHLMVLLRVRGLSINDVVTALRSRHMRNGGDRE